VSTGEDEEKKTVPEVEKKVETEPGVSNVTGHGEITAYDPDMSVGVVDGSYRFDIPGMTSHQIDLEVFFLFLNEVLK